jgi:hypothetical protein
MLPDSFREGNEKYFVVFEPDPYEVTSFFLVRSPIELEELLELAGSHFEQGLEYYRKISGWYWGFEDLDDYLAELNATDLLYWTLRYLEAEKPELGISLVPIDRTLAPNLSIGYLIRDWRRDGSEPSAEFVLYDEIRRFLARKGYRLLKEDPSAVE